MTTYHVNERDSYITVAQLSPEFTARLVDHWRELRGENVELKALVAAQGKKIDMLCDKILMIATPPASSDTVAAERSSSKRKHVYCYDVIEVKALHNRGLSEMQMAAETGFSPLTIRRIVRGERDHLLVP
ncbi:MAG: hypothetical protein F9K32_00595 [Desulfobulbaceae bacterium]|nr:MAG: hypothetical protein F9K32_00595 [Desulfobulbaceae bacterium]